MAKTTKLVAADTIQGIAGSASAVFYSIWATETISEVATYALLASGVLGTSVSTLYTVPAGSTINLKAIYLESKTGASVSGIAIGIGGITNILHNTSTLSLPANSALVLSYGIEFSHGAQREIVSESYIGLSNRAPSSSDFLVKTADSGLSAERVVTDTASAIWDWATAGQAKVNVQFGTPSPTTPLALSAAGSGTVSVKNDHTHRSPGGVASIVAATAAITTTETQVVGATLPASFLAAGSTLRIDAYGVSTSTVGNAITFRMRIGSTTLTGNIAASLVPVGLTTAVGAGFHVGFLATVRTDGAGGTILGNGFAETTSAGGAVQAFVDAVTVSTNASTVAVDTTGSLVVELTAVTAAATSSVTFHVATIEVVKM